MRKIKSIKIDDKEIAVKELTVQQILNLWERFSLETLSLFDLVKEIAGMSTDLTLAELQQYAPSEIEEMYKVFCEVNGSFLGIWAYLELGKPIKDMLRAMINQISNLSKA